MDFHIVTGKAAEDILDRSHERILEIIRDIYLLHEDGGTVNPPSYFLRFPDKSDSRVIALPAYVAGTVGKVGLKWISSFPGNLDRAIPRASGVLILNRYTDGYPLACLEASRISAARTAASAALAARLLVPSELSPSVMLVGTGVIARTVLTYLRRSNLGISKVRCFDLNDRAATRFAAGVNSSHPGLAEPVESIVEALDSDIVVFTTTAGSPWVPADVELRPGQVVLNISLRDLAPESLLSANNIVDDVDHCLTAGTSPHLAEQLTKSRDFVNGTLGGLVRGTVELHPGRPTVVSPFGMGVLDVAVGAYVLDQAIRDDTAMAVDEFFGHLAARPE